MVATSSRPELLVIVGETASGKSDLALRIAKEYGGEIISADSWTVYHGFDIGTGKPSSLQRKAVKHHLIDVREPEEGFNAPLFKIMAEEALAEIRKRGRLPILVGGTGLYVDSLLYDFGFLPNSDEREKLDRLQLSELLDLARERKIKLSGVDVRNKRRVIRAIEAEGEIPAKGDLMADALLIGLRLPRIELLQRVEKRTDKMLAAGLEQEVKSLAEKYGWDIEPMKGIGYREWREYFESNQTLIETRQRIISSTMNLAKRQRTWFKRNPDIQWFASAQQAYDFIISALNT